ncbi:hypothetical protein Taro_053413 [Colocasia esculenta]|uniref:Uncharacterized protein n=1 Tax=Colocasia esculenta TaxID=4460 RepID=A0A843XMZ5_COLES|nr:hypothetical protein [Colocasia esculenta]
MPTLTQFPLLGLELEERGRNFKNSFSPRDPLLLGLFSTSNNLWQRARVGQEGLGGVFKHRWNVKVINGTGIGELGAQFLSHMGIISKLHYKIWQKGFVKLPADIINIIFRDLELIFRWDRTTNTDKQMLMHMSSVHYTWRGVLKKRHYTGKSFEDVIASVPAGVNPHDWQIMCEKWNTSDEQNIADRNKANRSHQSMPYRKGRKTHYQLKDDFERMIQLSATSLDSESGSTPISTEEAFVSINGKDRSGRICCRGSWEIRRTWYGRGAGRSSSNYQQHRKHSQNGD